MKQAKLMVFPQEDLDVTRMTARYVLTESITNKHIQMQSVQHHFTERVQDIVQNHS